MNGHRHRRPRGFTIVIGIALLGLIATAIVLVTRQMGYEMQRTRSAYDDAQLRQLLLAGGEDAIARASAWTADRPAPDHWALELPPALRDIGAAVSVRLTEAGKNARAAQVEARFRDREMTDTLRFAPTDQGWKLTGTTNNS